MSKPAGSAAKPAAASTTTASRSPCRPGNGRIGLPTDIEKGSFRRALFVFVACRSAKAIYEPVNADSATRPHHRGRAHAAVHEVLQQPHGILAVPLRIALQP